MDGFTRAVVGVVNDGARVVGAVNGIGAVVNGAYHGRHVSGRGPSTPTAAVNQAASLVNRADAAVLALTTASMDATRNVALVSASVAGLAAALWRSQRERSPRVSAPSGTLAAGLGALTESVCTTCNDPADAIRPLCALASLADLRATRAHVL